MNRRVAPSGSFLWRFAFDVGWHAPWEGKPSFLRMQKVQFQTWTEYYLRISRLTLKVTRG